MDTNKGDTYSHCNVCFIINCTTNVRTDYDVSFYVKWVRGKNNAACLSFFSMTVKLISVKHGSMLTSSFTCTWNAHRTQYRDTFQLCSSLREVIFAHIFKAGPSFIFMADIKWSSFSNISAWPSISCDLNSSAYGLQPGNKWMNSYTSRTCEYRSTINEY